MRSDVAPGHARTVGRYAIHEEIASGGMATVHVGRLIGAAGFARTVAIKRMHSELAKDPEFVSMFVDEARLAARIHHPNVVSTLDVVARGGELFVVMEFVHGESLAALVRMLRARRARMPTAIALKIAADMLAGLHAAHEALSESGDPLGIVHRDVSPQNVLVGAEGVTRIIDFGVAKASGRLQTTREGQIKGKISYMSPEQLTGEQVDRRSDVYSASVVLWEMLAGTRLFQGDNQGHTLQLVLARKIPALGQVARGVPPAVDAIVLCGLARAARDRYRTARDMAIALESLGPASTNDVAEWLKALVGESLALRATKVADVESGSSMAARTIGGGELVHGEETWSDRTPEGARLLVRPTETAPETTISGSVSSSLPERGLLGRGSRVIGIVIGAGLALAGAVSLVRATRAPADTSTAAATPTPASSSSAPPADPLPSALADDAASASLGSVDAIDSASPSAASPHAVRPRSAKARPAAPAPDCNPPFSIDERGIRTYKRECVTGRR